MAPGPAAGDVIPWCAAHGTAVIVYSPMHSGLLSGSFDAARLAPDDWRRREPDWTEKLDANLRVADALGGIAAAIRASGAGTGPERPA